MRQEQIDRLIELNMMLGTIMACLIIGNSFWELDHLSKSCVLEDGMTSCTCEESIDCMIDADGTDCHCDYKPPAVMPHIIVLQWITASIGITVCITSYIIFIKGKDKEAFIYSISAFLFVLIAIVFLIATPMGLTYCSRTNPLVVECQTFTEVDGEPLYLGAECLCSDVTEETTCETSTPDVGCYCMAYRDADLVFGVGQCDNLGPSLLRIFTYKS